MESAHLASRLYPGDPPPSHASVIDDDWLRIYRDAAGVDLAFEIHETTCLSSSCGFRPDEPCPFHPPGCRCSEGACQDTPLARPGTGAPWPDDDGPERKEGREMEEKIEGPIARAVKTARAHDAAGISRSKIRTAIRAGWSDWPDGMREEVLRIVDREVYGELARTRLEASRGDPFGFILHIDPTPSGEYTAATTLASFIEANDPEGIGLEDPELMRVALLEVGDELTIGGGAAAETVLRRVR